MAEVLRIVENHLSTIQSGLGNPAGMVEKKYHDIVRGDHVSRKEPEQTEEEIRNKFIQAF